MNNIEQLLGQLGFSEYEARAYIALLKQSPLNGYELAKSSNLPRANVYAVLQKLEDRGAVVRLDTPAGARYSPVSPSELTRRLGSNFQQTLDAAQRSLEEITSPVEHEYVWNARGYSVLLDHARALVDATQHRLLVATWPLESEALGENLARAEERGVELTTLCMAACVNECGNCRERLFRFKVPPSQPNRWLVLVSDDSELVTGEIGVGDEALAVRTRHRLLVDLAGWYIRHSIALAAVLTDLNGRLEGLLQPETLSALAALGPGSPSDGWLEHMQRLLHTPGVIPPNEGSAQ
jgi:predicted transcriptional regulator